MKSAIIIPSRIGSTRLPNKPLALINGKTLVGRCIDCALSVKNADIFVATDSDEIYQIAKKSGVTPIMTPSNLPSGTDRIMHAYEQIGKKYSHIVNLQGDIPNISPKIIEDAINLAVSTNCDIATIVTHIDEKKAQNPSRVKAVLSPSVGFYKALYFSRQPIPHNAEQYFEHIGVYVYTPESLKKFTSLSESILEKTEKLEQLRALENNMSIYASVIDSSLSPISIDTPEDLHHANAFFRKKEIKSTTKYKALAESLKENIQRRKA